MKSVAQWFLSVESLWSLLLKRNDLKSFEKLQIFCLRYWCRSHFAQLPARPVSSTGVSQTSWNIFTSTQFVYKKRQKRLWSAFQCNGSEWLGLCFWRFELHCPPPHHPHLQTTSHPATRADCCARLPSRPQRCKSDNIRSILFPVTHSPRPTVKWKRLLEAVNGGRERGGSQWTFQCLSVCIHMFSVLMCVHLPCTDVVYVYFMCVSVALKSTHSRKFEEPGRSEVKSGLSSELSFLCI